jgi:integrase
MTQKSRKPNGQGHTHDARHIPVTLMYSQSIGIETISRTLGHSSSAITSRLYVYSAEEPLRNAAEAIN